MIRIGTAGWSLPTRWQDRFPEGETHFHRYAEVLNAVEINRTFKKLPRPSTFDRWADSVPAGFRFSVKAPREVTPDRRLEDTREPLAELLETAGELGDGLGPLLVQLPPPLEFDRGVAEEFLGILRELRPGPGDTASSRTSGSTAGRGPIARPTGRTRRRRTPTRPGRTPRRWSWATGRLGSGPPRGTPPKSGASSTTPPPARGRRTPSP